MVQPKDDLEDWYSGEDPWGYYNNPQDTQRKDRILAAIPKLDYENVVDIGAGNGFLTRDLPGRNIIGTDISEKAVEWANRHTPAHVRFVAGSLFDLPEMGLPPMDLIVITGVLYPQYIAKSIRLVYVLIDQLLKPGGILLCSHISDWYRSRFPYLTLSREYFAYRDFSQILEVYSK